MDKVSGRSDDMLIIRGVNVFPSQIESVLMGFEGTEPHYQIIVDRKGSLDDIEVMVEVNEKIFSDEIKVMNNLSKNIADRSSVRLMGNIRWCLCPQEWGNRSVTSFRP